MHTSVEHVTDPAHLKQIIALQQAEIDRLLTRLMVLTRQLSELKGEPAEARLQAELFDVQAHLARLQKQLFGPKSERRHGADAQAGAAETSAGARKAPQTGHGPRAQQKLPLEEHIHDLDEADKVCPKCGDPLAEMKGQHEESGEITVVERRYVLVKHLRKKYRCRCNGCVETALGPKRLIPGGRYSVAFGVHVAVSKYLDSLPLSRQVSMMARQGLVVDEQTLFDQLHAVAMRAEPTWQALRRHILAQGVVHADETPWKLMGKGPSQTCWVWSLSCHDACFYDIQPSRGHPVADALLSGFEGVLIADGMGAYGALTRLREKRQVASILLAGCLAHVRRGFIEAERFFYREAHPFVELIGQVYQVEREAQQLAAEERPPGDPGLRAALLAHRRRLREECSRPLMAALHHQLKTTPARPTSALGKAIGYALGQWSSLLVFLDHPAVDVDNNRAERALRLPVVGRKNFYGNRSDRGLKATSILYSLLATAREHRIDPQPWLEALVDRALDDPQAVLLPWDFRPA